MADYPDALAEAMVRQHLRFQPGWGPEMLVERDELLTFYEWCTAAERRILRVLAGLNRRYYPGDKWVDRFAATLPLAPTQLGPRLKQVFREPSPVGVQVLQELIEEVFALVATYMPALDIREAEAWFRHRRAI